MARRRRGERLFREKPAVEVSEEFDFHVEMRVRELVARGLSPEQARRAALSRFGDMAAVQAACEDIAAGRNRDRQRAAYWSEFSQDVRFALRQFRTSPGFSMLVICILALGVGATTTIFSVLNGVVLSPLAFPHQERVHFLLETWHEQGGDFAAGGYVDVRAQLQTFEEVAAIDWSNVVVTLGDSPERVLGAAVSRNYFDVYGVRPALGRGFTEADEQPGAARVALLSAQAFRTGFHGDARSVLGRDVRLNGEPVRIIGVLPEGFDPLLLGEAVYLPLQVSAEQVAARGSRYLNLVGLARPGVSAEAIASDLARVTALLRERFPVDQEGRRLEARPLREVVTGDYGRRLTLLLASVALVLLIACANVANLLLARGGARQKEIAVRGALGAGRGRILRQLLTENLVLSLATVVAALLAAWAGIRLIVGFGPENVPRLDNVRIDGVVLLFAFGVSIVSSLLFGLAPALRTMRLDMQSTLRSGGRDARAVVRDWMRNALVGAEVALCVLLLTAAGLLIRTSIEAGRVDPGFRTDGVLSGRVTLPAESYATGEQARVAFQRLTEAIAGRPGVVLAAAASLPPLGTGGNEMFLAPEGRVLPQGTQIAGRMRIVSRDYLAAMGIPLRAGRAFDDRDNRSGTRVAIVSEDLAAQLFPGQDPLGRRFGCCDDTEDPLPWTIIGVSAPVRAQGPLQQPYPDLYIPLAQAPDGSWPWFGRTMSLIAVGRESAPPASVIREAVREVDPGLPVYGLTTLHDALRALMAGSRLNAMLLTLLGFIGLALAASGIYGVVSYFVTLRTREIGIRMALGASRTSVVGLMIRRTMPAVIAGLAVGTAAALAANRLLQGYLFGVSTADPLTFAAVLLGIATVAGAAALLPARRAARIAPTDALLE